MPEPFAECLLTNVKNIPINNLTTKNYICFSITSTIELWITRTVDVALMMSQNGNKTKNYLQTARKINGQFSAMNINVNSVKFSLVKILIRFSMKDMFFMDDKVFYDHS